MPEENDYIDLSKWTVKELVRKSITETEELRKDFEEYQTETKENFRKLYSRIDELEGDSRLYKNILKWVGVVIGALLGWFGFLKDWVIRV
jgi:hypothetical protein